MNFPLLLWLSAVCSANVLMRVAGQYCSSYCKCGLFEGRNFADCSGKRLINPYVDLSSSVEVLDLSYNDIAIIDENCFKNYNFLVNLTITHNDIHTIYLDAFVKLRHLKDVDLSYNRIEYLDERLFESNRHLQTLNLEGNKFMSLPLNRPLLRSTSLRVLSLRNTGINSISDELLTALPQLNELDLSQNLMITFNAASFNALKHLTVLTLDFNPWNCDNILVRSLSIVRHHSVNVSIAECDAAYSEWQQQLPLRVDSSKHTQVSNKFERMTMQSSETNMNATNKIEKPIETVNWRNISAENEDSDNDDEPTTVGDGYGNGDVDDNDDGDGDGDDDEDMLDFANYINNKRTSASRFSFLGVNVDEELCDGTHENLCHHYRNCLEQVSNVLIKQMQEHNKKTVTYTQIDLEFAFFLGIAVGITSVVSMISCALCVKNCCKMKKRNNNDLEAIYESVSSMPSTHPVHPIHTHTHTVPQAPSRRPRRTHRPQNRPMQHAIVHRPHGSDSFIGRLLGRPARQEYYRVSTATLIRCLSRSNLFNNLQNNTNSSARNNSTSPTADEAPLNVTRPETPPPTYGDIIDKK